MIEDIFLTTLRISVEIGCLILLLKLMSRLLNQIYAAKWKYYIWFILAVRLMIPFALPIPEPAIQVRIPEASVRDIPAPVVSGQKETVEQILEVPDMPPYGTMPHSSLSPRGILTIVWLTGVFLFLGIQLTGYYSFQKQIKRWNRKLENPGMGNRIQSIALQMGIKRAVPVFINGKITSPMMIGLFHPSLLIPEEEYTDSDISFIVQHEFVHYQRHDMWYKLILLLANALHWFNPLVYCMRKEADRDMELSCDDEVIKGKSAAERKAYSEAILTAIHRGKMKQAAFMTLFYGGTKTMKERFQNIFDNKKKHRGFLTALLVTVTVISAGTLVGFTKSEAKDLTLVENVNVKVQNCNIILKVSEDGEFKYVYDETFYELDATEEGTTLDITVKSTDKPQNGLTDMATIYLPNKTYDKITVQGEQAGISVPALNADFDLINQDGAMGLSVDKGFQKSIHFKNMNGSGSLVISSLADNYTLNMTQTGSAVSVSSEMPDYSMQEEYEYVKGNGKAKIDMEIQGSAFSILVKDENYVSTEEDLTDTIDKLGSNVKKYGPFLFEKGDTWTPSITWEGKATGGVYIASQLTSLGGVFHSGQFMTRTDSGDAYSTMTIEEDGEYWILVGNQGKGTVEDVQLNISFTKKNK